MTCKKTINYLESLLLEAEIKNYGRSLSKQDYIDRHFNLPINKIYLNNVPCSATKEEILELWELVFEKPPFKHQDPIAYGQWKNIMDSIVSAAKEILPNTFVFEQIPCFDDLKSPIFASLEDEVFNARILYTSKNKEPIEPIILFHSGLFPVADILPRFFLEIIDPTGQQKQLTINLNNIHDDLYNKSVLIAFPYTIKYLLSTNHLFGFPYPFEESTYSNFNHIYTYCILLFIAAHEYSHYLLKYKKLCYNDDIGMSAEEFGLSEEEWKDYDKAWQDELQADGLAILLTLKAAHYRGFSKNNVCTGILLAIITIDILTKAHMLKFGIYEDCMIPLSSTHPPTEYRIRRIAATLFKSYEYNDVIATYIQVAYKCLWHATRRHILETELVFQECGTKNYSMEQFVKLLTDIVKSNINSRDIFGKS